MDDAQKWAVACTRMALMDYGWPERPLDLERTAVDPRQRDGGREALPDVAAPRVPRARARPRRRARASPRCRADVRAAIARRAARAHGRPTCRRSPRTRCRASSATASPAGSRTSSTCAGRTSSSTRRARRRWPRWTRRSRAWSSDQFDAVVTGGVDRNMGVASFIKFCAIGALSAHRHAPVRRRRRRLRDGRGRRRCSCSSGSPTPSATATASTRSCAAWPARATARARASPRPTRSARSWRSSAPGATRGCRPRECSMIEGHGTSTAVGDFVELTSLGEAFAGAGPGARLGRARLREVEHRPPQGRGRRGRDCSRRRSRCTTRCCRRASTSTRPNPNVDWSATPFAVNTELRDWEVRRTATPRVAGVSAFGFGGTNFHAVLEEYVPGRLTDGNGHARSRSRSPCRRRASRRSRAAGREAAAARRARSSARPTRRRSPRELRRRWPRRAGPPPRPAAPSAADLRAPERDLHRLRATPPSWPPRPSRR